MVIKMFALKFREERLRDNNCFDSGFQLQQVLGKPKIDGILFLKTLQAEHPELHLFCFRKTNST